MVLNLGYVFESPGECLKTWDALCAPSELEAFGLRWGPGIHHFKGPAAHSDAQPGVQPGVQPFLPQSPHFSGKELRPDGEGTS